MKRLISLILAAILAASELILPSSSSVPCVHGDLNGDGKIGAKDVQLLMQSVAGWQSGTDKNAADVNGDGIADARDVSKMMKYVTGWRVLLGVEGLDALAEEMKKNVSEAASPYEFAGVGKRNAKYYVSSDGDDFNDGLSPETPLETIEALTYYVKLKAGDIVLFRRGDVFRGKIQCVEGVTYSSYGEGDLPVINGSPFDGAVYGSWEETEFPNVYRYSETFDGDVGLITYNNAEGYIGKVCIDYINGWESATIGQVIGTYLTKDMTFFQVDPKAPCALVKDPAEKGALYMYSEKGDPAERFDNLEFSTYGNIFNATNGVTVSHLHLAFGGSHGVGAGTCKNLKVEYCELSWIGGSIQHYESGAPGKYVRYGNAVEIFGGCDNYTVDHCWIHDVYDAGVTHQYNAESDSPCIMQNVTYSDNLIERCVYSVEYFNRVSGAGEKGSGMKNILIRGNVCRCAGVGFGYAERRDRNARHIQGGWLGGTYSYDVENYVIENNIFDRSEQLMFSIASTDASNLPVMRGNTYIQYRGERYGYYGTDYTLYYPFDDTVEKVIRETQGESDAEIYFVER